MAMPKAPIDIAKDFEGPIRRFKAFIAERGPMSAHLLGRRGVQDHDRAWSPPQKHNQAGLHLAVIVDFTFNLGAGRLQTSTLRTIRERDWAAPVQELRRWFLTGASYFQA